MTLGTPVRACTLLVCIDGLRAPQASHERVAMRGFPVDGTLRCLRTRRRFAAAVPSGVVLIVQNAKAELPSIRFHTVGDVAITATLIGRDAHARARALARTLQFDAEDGVLSVLPAFDTITLYYDPAVAGPGHFDRVCRRVHLAADRLDMSESAPARTIEIPVLYGGEHGADLDELSRKLNCSAEEVVELHCAPEYTVAALGFLPGFAYLTGLDPRLIVPRRATPRSRVPAGSVAIGGPYSGVYPVDSPAGWNILGRTTAPLFDPRRPVANILAVGDRIRFRRIEA